MNHSRRLHKKIFTSKVHFKDIIDFLKAINSKENILNNEKILHIIFTSSDESIFTFYSIESVLDEHNLAELENAKITAFIIRVENVINIMLTDTYVDIDYEINAKSGHVVFEIAVEILKLRTSSLFGFLADKPIHYLALPLMIIGVINLYFKNFNVISVFLFTSSSLLILVLSEHLSKISILMGTNRDSFWYRKKDDLFISSFFLIIGYLLGAIMPIQALFNKF